jgi:GNAT superfamily N-acetyltransferase
VLGVELDGLLVASCTLTLTPNLARGTRPWGQIENVVTHRDYRKRGLGQALVNVRSRLPQTHVSPTRRARFGVGRLLTQPSSASCAQNIPITRREDSRGKDTTTRSIA